MHSARAHVRQGPLPPRPRAAGRGEVRRGVRRFRQGARARAQQQGRQVGPRRRTDAGGASAPCPGELSQSVSPGALQEECMRRVEASTAATRRRRDTGTGSIPVYITINLLGPQSPVPQPKYYFFRRRVATVNNFWQRLVFLDERLTTPRPQDRTRHTVCDSRWALHSGRLPARSSRRAPARASWTWCTVVFGGG